MTYPDQYAWLSAHGFLEVDICSQNSILWRKKYPCFHLDLYWSQWPKTTWALSILDEEGNADIYLTELDEHADFAQLESLISFFDTQCITQ